MAVQGSDQQQQPELVRGRGLLPSPPAPQRNLAPKVIFEPDRIYCVLPVNLQTPILFAGGGVQVARAGQESVMTRSHTAASRLTACPACRRRIARRPPADRRDPAADPASHQPSYG